jgi:hypothetical protein
LVVPGLFVAFVTLAGTVVLATARRLVVALRSAERVVFLLRATGAFGALAVLFFRISTVVGFLSTEFLRLAALLFEVPARAIVLALFEAPLPVVFAVWPARALGAGAAVRDRADDPAAALATLRFVEDRAPAAPDFEPLAFEVVRVLALAFDFFELFLRDAIRASLLPRSARQAEHATGSPDRQPGPVSDRQPPINPASYPRLRLKPRSNSRPIRNRVSKKAPEFGAQWQTTGEAVRSES